ncbi:odorant receptor 49b-like [Coccinella septempunctata]|uniref:odorant receptor 49b-like n=1 Tax=Coccinella septempunctata TaxID=41139 RepID=UPI001D05E211|nr:odorant receptor 49b-like [Coccinella septempunctata]
MMLSQSEELSSQSLELAESIYSTKWYEMPVEHRKLLYIMLVRAQKPLVFSCGGLYMANLNTFMKTMKTVYTIVNALINLNK